jgi:hypothetical protein
MAGTATATRPARARGGVDELLATLYLHTQAKVSGWIDRCLDQGVVVQVVAAFRGHEEQAEVFAAGLGSEPWKSFHGVSRAVDFVVLVGGKPDWLAHTHEYWTAVTTAQKEGLGWRAKDPHHLEDPWCYYCRHELLPRQCHAHFEEDGSCKIENKMLARIAALAPRGGS